MPWISTYTGGRFDFDNLRPEQVKIEDIAHSLALTNRFNGHTKFPYSVAQHSILCAHLINDRRLAFDALMHDATEAYMPDLSSPLKRFLPEFKELENKIWQQAIAPAFGLSGKYAAVKMMDIEMLITEASQLLDCNWWKEPHWPKPIDIFIEEWTWTRAESEFLMSYYQYKGKNDN